LVMFMLSVCCEVRVETSVNSQIRKGHLDIYSLRLVSINGYRRLLSVQILPIK
jgi:hypothetical protein